MAGAALGAGLAVLSLAVTVDNVLGARAPAVAARWGTGSAIVGGTLANRLIQPDASPAVLGAAAQLAKKALRREPGNVAAVRALGQVSALRGDLPNADRSFRYSQRLSRRDLFTQTWLIEERVRHGDIAGALTHYDRALRTARRARPLLFPLLVPAMSSPEIARAGERLMAKRPSWGPDFLSVMAQAPDASPEALGRLAIASSLRPGLAAEREALEAVLRRLVASDQYGAAEALWGSALKVRDVGQQIRSGDFEADPLLPPFDWTFANTGNLSATRETSAGGTALVLRAENSGAGEFARQLVTLEPGAYTLGVTTSGAGTDPLARAAIAVSCMAGGREFVRLSLSAVAQARLSTSFTVPRGCNAQLLTIAAPAGLGQSNAGVVIDDLTIAPLRGRVRTAAQEN